MDTNFLQDHRAADLHYIAIIAFFFFHDPSATAASHGAAQADGGGTCIRGDTVVTAGGIVGRVTKVGQPEDPEITVEIADNIQIRVVKSTLSEVRAKTQPVDSKAGKAEVETAMLRISSFVQGRHRASGGARYPDWRPSGFTARTGCRRARARNLPAWLGPIRPVSLGLDLRRAAPMCCSRSASTRSTRTSSKPLKARHSTGWLSAYRLSVPPRPTGDDAVGGPDSRRRRSTTKRKTLIQDDLNPTMSGGVLLPSARVGTYDAAEPGGNNTRPLKMTDGLQEAGEGSTIVTQVASKSSAAVSTRWVRASRRSTREGDDRIVVQVPGLSDPQAARSTISARQAR